MTAKEYLQQAFYLDRLIETNQVQLEQFHQLSVSIQTNGRSDYFTAKIFELETIIQSDLNQYTKTKIEILNTIKNVKDEKLRLILQKRYLDFKIWEDIAEEINYTGRWLRILHKKALKAAEKYILVLHH